MDNKNISIVIAVHDRATELEQNLPLFLQLQQLGVGEVVVVDDASTDDTPDVLKRLKAQYDGLYTTFLPDSGHNPSRLRLALTIGVKATRGDWIVLCDIHRPPMTADWLAPLSEADGELVLIYNNRKTPEAPGHYQYFDHLEQAVRLLTKAERHSGRGHRGRWFKDWRGHYDALAVRRERVFDAIMNYDRPLRGGRLMVWQLAVLISNLR